MQSCSGVASILEKKKNGKKIGESSFIIVLLLFSFFSFLTCFDRYLLFYSLTLLPNLMFIIKAFHLDTTLGLVTN